MSTIAQPSTSNVITDHLQKIPVNDETLRTASGIAHNGALSLAAIINEQGRFTYRFHAETGAVLKGYSVLRHCGTIWAMLDVFHRLECPESIVIAASRAIQRIERQYALATPDGKLKRVITPWKDQMRLGGNGLAILALLKYHAVTSSKKSLNLAITLGDYILSEQLEDGNFIHFRTHSSNEPDLEKRCEYYPGECLFALMELYHATNDDKWLNAVAGNRYHVGSDYGIDIRNHWMNYALESLDRAQPDERYRAQAEAISKQIINALNRGTAFENNKCCAIATMSEGLLAYLRIELRRQVDQRGETFNAAKDAVKRALSYQKTQQQPNGQFLLGGSDAPIIRIDSTQHNISAFLHYNLLADQLG